MTRTRLRAQLACPLPAAVLAAALLCPRRRGAGAEFRRLPRQSVRRGEPAAAARTRRRTAAAQAPPQWRKATPATSACASTASRTRCASSPARIEQLQHQNQMLQMQLKRMQDDTEYRFQQMGAKGSAPCDAAWQRRPPRRRPPRRDSAQTSSIRRSIPTRRARRARSAIAGDRRAGAAGPEWRDRRQRAADRRARRTRRRRAARSVDACRQCAAPPPTAAAGKGRQRRAATARPCPRRKSANCRRRRRAIPSATGTQLATLPPSASPKDEYQLAYGYVLHKDYALAEQAFRDFMRKYPHEKLVPDAQYWLGESLFQQQRYRDAAESFLAVSTKYEHSGKAPEALLRLGQSLAALHQKEAACATFAEVGAQISARLVAREARRRAGTEACALLGPHRERCYPAGHADAKRSRFRSRKPNRCSTISKACPRWCSRCRAGRIRPR